MPSADFILIGKFSSDNTNVACKIGPVAAELANNQFCILGLFHGNRRISFEITEKMLVGDDGREEGNL